MMRKYPYAWTALLVLLLWATPHPAQAQAQAEDDPFPLPRELERDVAFWTRIYTEVGTEGGLLHDSRDLDIVYEVVQLPAGSSSRGHERHTDARKRHYRDILNDLARGKRSSLGGEQRRVLALFPADVSNSTLASAAKHIRFQLGQANKFRAGVVRSGAYIAHIRAILTDMGLPEDISALPHVESSFTPHAWSRVGAAGLWQFTRSTGRRFMQVDHVVDERLDPYRASIAAARLLEQNHRVTGSWPLAITAYNHGAAGMRRASRQLGTSDIATIVRSYKSRTFGFASRNFYVEFLAAAKIARNPERYFGALVLDQPIAYESVVLPFHTTPEALSRGLGVELASLRAANPALLPAVWQGQKRVPRGFELSVPRAELARPLSVALESIPDDERFAQQTRDTYHVVRRGETLSGIATRYGLRPSELQALNGLRSQNHIRAGQKIRLPSDRAASPQILAAIAPPADGRYTVRRGDNLSKIATRFGMSEQELAAANDLQNRHRIYVGQVLRVSAEAEPIETARAAEAPAMREQADEAPAVAETAGGDSHPQALAQLTPARAAEPTPELEEPLAPAFAEAPTARLPDAAMVSVAAEAGEATPIDPDSMNLLADPNDYSVASDGTIEVQATETLGHYAEWLGLRASRLRAINHLRYEEGLPVHSRIRLDFASSSPEEFERRRVEYHRAMQEEFFAQWEIAGVETHRMRRGDSLWLLSHRRFNVPIWLLRQYNPDLDFEALSAGSEITVPLLKQREGEDGAQSADSADSDAASRLAATPEADRES